MKGATANLQPHIDDGDRGCAATDIAACEYYAALASCIPGCYLNGYRIPEDYLQENEEFVDGLYCDSFENGGPDYWVSKLHIQQIRSLDNKSLDPEPQHPYPAVASAGVTLQHGPL